MTSNFPLARNILIIKHGALGDVIQSLGALCDVRHNYPKSTLTVLTTHAMKKIFSRCPYIDHVVIDNRPPRWNLVAMAKLRRRLRGGNFDMVYDLQNSGRTKTYYHFFSPKIPWSGTARGCSHPHKASNPKSIPGLERLEGQLKDAGLKVQATGNLKDTDWLRANTLPLLRAHGIDENFVLLFPGSSKRHPQKRWPYYGALATKLLRAGYQVVTAPGPDEIDLCQRLASTTASVTVLLEQDGSSVDFFALADLCARARLVVGNDTGPSHIASFMNSPTLALFGNHASAQHTSIVRNQCTALEATHLEELTVNKVWKAVAEKLALAS